MYGHRNTRIESVVFIKSKQKTEESSVTSSSVTTSTTTTSVEITRDPPDSSDFYDNDSPEDSIVPRPTRHIGDICFCYENPEDCTTCSQQDTDDSDIFMLASSESERSLAGSSSEDGSSIGSEEETSGELSLETLFSAASSTSSTLESENLQELIDALRSKKLEFHEDFIQNSTTFGQMMTMHGFQRAVLNDRLIDLNRLVASQKSEKESIETEFNESDVCQMILEYCHVEHAKSQNRYWGKMFDGELMNANKNRIEGITEKLKRMKIDKILEEKEPPESVTEENWDKILDDVSTGQSFCRDDWDQILDDVSTCQSFCLDDL